ncbi:conserved protein, unknown function [Plasmodium ovale wallikeri]|uniref:Uncharacterized protein n=1 Tax=Plasmodium ovale wallikeri TaxID=864142 RepID=A0A1A8YWA7_PLAOA|nr:conserved protein, unknown function [Plasmodium ovale wallikeri]
MRVNLSQNGDYGRAERNGEDPTQYWNGSERLNIPPFTVLLVFEPKRAYPVGRRGRGSCRDSAKDSGTESGTESSTNIGTYSRRGSGRGKYCDGDEGKKKCVINNSVPLFHTHMLSPFLNLAFTLVENHYKDKEDRIVGYYHISADDSKNVDIKKIKVCELVSEKLVKNYEDALICLVQMSRMQFEEGNCMFMQEDSGQWENVDVEISVQNREFLKKNISNKGYLNIHDFDDHLNCINYDFMNPNLFNNVS